MTLPVVDVGVGLWLPGEGVVPGCGVCVGVGFGEGEGVGVGVGGGVHFQEAVVVVKKKVAEAGQETCSIVMVNGTLFPGCSVPFEGLNEILFVPLPFAFAFQAIGPTLPVFVNVAGHIQQFKKEDGVIVRP